MGDITVDVVDGKKAVVRRFWLRLAALASPRAGSSCIAPCTHAHAWHYGLPHVYPFAKLLSCAGFISARGRLNGGYFKVVNTRGIQNVIDNIQGGAIAYAAAVASAYGVKACVVTAAGPDADLEVFRGHELHVVPTNSTLTFEHTYTWWGESSSPVPDASLHSHTHCSNCFRCSTRISAQFI